MIILLYDLVLDEHSGFYGCKYPEGTYFFPFRLFLQIGA